ncbi:MAG: hypothetical protein K8R59_13930 [Thermoanaerobaculales bacterium]|nr:hypothetical protein [Thermoanaerobaculales bacterium]
MKLLMECHEGRVVSLFLENGFLERCVEKGAEVKVISQATTVPGFVERYGIEGVSWAALPVHRDLTRFEALAMRIGRKFSTSGMAGARRLLWSAFERPSLARKAGAEQRLIREFKPDVVFSPNIAEGFGRRLIGAAGAMGIPSVGNLASWDNTYRPLRVRPDEITCWSDRAERELCAWCAYRADQVKVTGAPAFDPYFRDGATWNREKLCKEMALDPARPIILYASLGQFRPFMDETGTFAALVEALDQGLVPGNPQIVLRLHPLSRLVYFDPFLNRADVTVSRFKGYIPGMMWTPMRDEVILAGNLMRHADVCISPGSTMTIEPAIFDTPTLLPVVNLYTQEAYTEFFRQIWLEGHFREIVEKSWVPVVRTVEELGGAITKALGEPSWYGEGRAAIRETILGPLDGQATERIAAIVVRPRERNA